MKISPHTHAESPLTGSTIASLISKAVELGRTHFAYTDHGHLSSAMKVYGQAKKKGLKFVPGLEIYFKDPNCSILSPSKAGRCRYFTVTIYCQDQAAFQALAKLSSRTDLPTIQIYEEDKQLWGWKELEEISKFNTNIVLGGIHCLVGKTLLAGDGPAAQSLLVKLNHMFTSRLYLSILCEPWTKKWNSVVEVKYVDGTRDTLLSSDTVTTDRARRIRAIDLTQRSGHNQILSKNVGITHYQVNKEINKVILHKGFLPLPGGDATLKINKFFKAMSGRMGLKLLATDYAYYASKEDKVVQTMRLEGADKLQPNLHMKSEDEIKTYLEGTLGVTPDGVAQILQNNDEWAALFDGLKLDYPWHLADVGEQPIRQAMEIIKKNGRMEWNNPVYTDRLREELEVIAKNPVKDLTPYFLPIRDVLNHYTENGFLVGPGRGSAGGSLFAYLLGITQINPFKYDLPFQRFFSMDRINMRELPDIDVDLEDREPLVGADDKSGYLFGKYGDKAAQISTRTTIRLKSAILDTNRYFKGKVEEEVEKFSKGLPTPPQGVTDGQFVFGFEDQEGHHVPGLVEISEELKAFAEKRPEEWNIVSKAMGLTRAFSKHACAFVLSDIAIQDVVPTKEGYITQYEAKECEAAGLIKYDFLVISQLKDIRICLELINRKNKEQNTVGYFSHEGQNTYVWDLPETGDVFKSVWGGQTETCFQINTVSMIPYVKDILPGSIMDLATILALVRPGPLDFIDPNTGRNMVEEYVLRRRGESQPDIKELADLLPETYGIITFQEQLNKIARDLAGFPGQEAEILRKNMAKKKMVELMKMKPAFIEGAKKKVSEEIAEGIWDRMVTFGRYGFSIIHAVEYAHITYACMFFKHHYPLEWWAAILTNAKEKEITGKFWPYVKNLVLAPDINLSRETMVVDYSNDKLRAKFGVIRGVGDKSIQPIVDGRPYADIQDFVNKEVAGPSLTRKLIHVGVLDSLFPPKTSFFEKLQMFEDAVEIRSFRQKQEAAREKGKQSRLLQPKKGSLPEEYVGLHPMKEAAMKKSVLPTMPMDLYTLGATYSKVLAPYQSRPMVKSSRGYNTLLINGEQFERLDLMPGETIREDIYIAATVYVIEAKEFSYAKNSKRALKMVLDVDGYVTEKVLWPSYDSGKLEYPTELKKGVIATIFFRKRTGKNDMAISQIVVET